MATKKITFDPSAGVPVASNLTIYGGSDFSAIFTIVDTCLLYTSPSPRDQRGSRMPSSA